MWLAVIQKAAMMPRWFYGAAVFGILVVIVVALNNSQTPAPQQQPNAALLAKKPGVIPIPGSNAVEQTISIAGATKDVAVKGSNLTTKVFGQAEKVVDTTGKTIDFGADLVDRGIDTFNYFLPKSNTKAGSEKK